MYDSILLHSLLALLLGIVLLMRIINMISGIIITMVIITMVIINMVIITMVIITKVIITMQFGARVLASYYLHYHTSHIQAFQQRLISDHKPKKSEHAFWGFHHLASYPWLLILAFLSAVYA
jgi:membrane-bound ClpP family serine protease